MLVAGLTLGGCATLPPWRAVSPGLGTSVEVSPRGKRACVAVDRRRDGCFDGVSIHAIAFSSTGGHTAYPVRAGDRWSIVRDGVRGREWSGVGAPVLNADGSRLAYPALDGVAWHLVVDERAGPPVDAVMEGSIVFDPTGRRLAYAARLGDSVHVLLDDTVSRGWDGVAGLAFSGDGSHVAYIARVAPRMMLVLDGKEEQSHSRIGEFALSPDGSRWAYSMNDGRNWYSVENGVRVGPFASIRALAYSARTLSFVGRRDSVEALFINGAQRGGWYEAVERPVFDTTGGTWGFIATDRDSSNVYLGDSLVAREARAADLAIGANGRRYAYVASRGGAQTIVDDRGRHDLDMVIEGTLQFIESGSRWVCLAGDRQRRQLFVVVDGAATTERLDWTEMVRMVQQPDAAGALRNWVSAAGSRALRARERPR